MHLNDNNKVLSTISDSIIIAIHTIGIRWLLQYNTSTTSKLTCGVMVYEGQVGYWFDGDIGTFMKFMRPSSPLCCGEVVHGIYLYYQLHDLFVP